MNIAKLISTNLINIAIFGLILFFSQFMSSGATAGLVIVWLAYLIYSNYNVVFRTNNLIYDLERANKGLFDKQVERTKLQIKSMENRTDILKDLDPRDGDKFEIISQKCEEQFYNNVKYIIALMASYDYVSKPEHQKKVINSIVGQNEKIIAKLNALIEKEISLTKSVHDTDLREVDDLIESLQELVGETAEQ